MKFILRKFSILKSFINLAYKLFLRKTIIDKINDPSTEWDDKLIKALDIIFNYKGIPRTPTTTPQK